MKFHLASEMYLKQPDKQAITVPICKFKYLTVLCFFALSILYFYYQFNMEIFYYKRAEPPSRSDDFPIYSSAAVQGLPTNGSIFCWVMTSAKYFKTRVPAVNETWLKRCDHGQFFTTEPMGDETIPFTTVFSGLKDSYDLLFYKTMRGFHYPYVNISADFDWYMKTDDDSYIIMEHLREYLSQFNATEPLYLGYRFKPFIVNGYNSGGAGYILSNGAVKLFVERLYYNRTLCPYDLSEDLGLGRCLANLGVFPLDTRNSHEQHRFLPYSIQQHYETTTDDPLYTMWPEKRKYEFFAPKLISLHHQTPVEIRMIEVLLYKLNSPQLSKYHKA